MLTFSKIEKILYKTENFVAHSFNTSDSKWFITKIV